MPVSPILTYTGYPLAPAFKDEIAAQIPAALVASGTYPKGTVMAEVSGQSAVYALFLGGATGGTFSITVDGQTTTQAYNVGAAGLQTALQALPAIGSGNATVSGTTTLTITLAGALANNPGPVFSAVISTLTGATSQTFTQSTVGQTATGTYGVYAHGGSGGLGVPKGLMTSDCSTDAFGNIYYGVGGSPGQWGQSYPTVPIFVSGMFFIADIVGTLTNLIGDSTYWSIVQGSVSSGVGIIRIG